MTTLVLYPADLGGVSENAALPVAHHRIIGPAPFPERVHRIHVFVSQVVAIVMRHLPGIAESACGAVEIASDDIPADPPACQVVKCAHPASEQIRRFASEIAGHTKAEMLRRRRHCGHEHQRVQ